MKIAPLKGMNDYLPSEVALRDYLQNTILEVYRSAGFERIVTPAIEDIENIDKSEGGDNLNLIFKILKRGEKLQEAQERGEALADMGLRYDLTLPLSRYYANNRAHLLSPMKCIQTDRVYRAERPQKGRLREFVQCDIDILGSSSPDCEVELIHTTARALLAVGMQDFVVKVNDRALLQAVLQFAGVPQEQADSVCITLDKRDKIGAEGVGAELDEKGIAPAARDFLLSLLDASLTLEELTARIGEQPAATRLQYILTAARTNAAGRYDVAFDLSLIRGQGYYTGTVFEVQSREFRGSIAGGGRYDNLIGKFIGSPVPAVGFSIGFERIFSILRDRGFAIPNARPRVAFLYDSGCYARALAEAEALRATCDVSLFEKPAKVGKFIARLQEYGFDRLAEMRDGVLQVKELKE